jgi:malate permease and related proteins
MTQIAAVLLPIFAVVGLGALLRRVRFVPDHFFRDTNRLVYWVGIPAFLFYRSAEARLEGDAGIRIILALLAGAFISLAVGYLLAFVMRLPRASVSSLVQGSYRGNLAYVGLPVVLLALATQGARTSATEAIAVLAVAAITPVYNFVAIFVLVGGQEPGRRHARQRLLQLVVRLATNPLLLSCTAGLIVMAFGWRLPPPLRETFKLVGDLATPLALLGIGASLTFRNLRAHWQRASVAATIKLVISPLAGLALAVPLRLTGHDLQMALLYLATPTAAASYVMAQQLGADEGLAANIIVLTTFLSLPALGLVLALTG